jgi:hypothetical protein
MRRQNRAQGSRGIYDADLNRDPGRQRRVLLGLLSCIDPLVLPATNAAQSKVQGDDHAQNFGDINNPRYAISLLYRSSFSYMVRALWYREWNQLRFPLV